ncbi:MAG: efflux RND transporter permease subunit, partial [Acidobacteria bacterium]|nr:efflux RND transporter permease subunit [Acidobacteriota bacterium]
MKRLIDLPLDRPVAVLMLLLCLTVLGVVSVTQIPVSFMPTIDEPEIDINVPNPGSHPLENLRQIVQPIEEEVAAIPGVRNIFGSAMVGRAQVEVGFDWGVDVQLKKLEVREAVERARAKLPATVGHISVEGDTDGGSAEVIGGRISAVQDLSESWDLLDRRIRQPLERIKGVARVNLYGVDRQELRIDLNLEALRGHNIPIEQLIRTINAANLELDLGVIRTRELRYDVRSEGRFRDVETVRRLVVADGVRLADLADVNLREPTLMRGRHLNRKFAIGFDVYKESSANTVDTVARITARIETIRADPQLRGIDVVFWQNQAEEILGSMRGLLNAGLYGGFLALIVLFLFLRRITTTLIVAVAIPFSILVTAGGMYLFGLDFNVLTMLGLMLGVGMLVDNAVVVIENIYRLQAAGLSPRDAARQGAEQVSMAVLAATATTIIVWSWLFVTEPNTMKIMIGQVALVICLAVACSLLISLTFIPLAAARFAPKGDLGPGFVMRRLLPAYRRVLHWTLRHRVVTLGALILLAGSSAYPIMKIEKTGQPRQQTRDVLILYQIHDASTMEVLEGYVNTVEDWIESERETLGITDIYSWFSEQDNAVQTRVYLPMQQATEARFKRLKKQLMDGLPVIPGVELEIGDHHGGHQRGPRTGGFAVVALHGEDPEYLEQVAIDVEERLIGLAHVMEVFGPTITGRLELRVRIDPERARAAGLTPDRIAETIAFTFRGQHLRRFPGPNGELEMLVGLHELSKPGVSTLVDLPIPTPNGRTVALQSVAEIERARTPNRINRSQRRTTQRVTVQFDDEATTSAEMREAIGAEMTQVRLPEGYRWDWGQRQREDDEAL